MIRKIVVTSLLVVCALSAAAQRPRTRIEWGVLGGINIPDYTTNMSGTDVKNKLGWQAGITTAVNLGAFAVEPQILYVRQGLRIRPEGQKEINLKSNSIDVPVLLSFRLLRPVHTVGAGVKLLGHLLVDLRYNGQFKSKKDVVLPDGGKLDKLRTYNVALNFGYLF